VKVVLSGEGAYEVLAGYFPHKILGWTERYRSLVPKLVRGGVIPKLVAAAPAKLLGRAFDYPSALGERGKAKLLRYLDSVESHGIGANLEALISLFDPEDRLELYSDALRAETRAWRSDPPADLPFGKSVSRLEDILALQHVHWLQDDILNKQDKMTMANSIEGREPFLDHRLVEFLGTVPPHLKLAGGRNKVLLREYLKKILPEEVSRRPKKPFYIPMDKYLGTPRMRELLEDSLSEATVRKRGYFAPEAVHGLRESMMKGEFIHDKQVFSLLMLELWHRAFIDRR
jgi:asparagine synthase (glutamine-hydrolysing)